MIPFNKPHLSGNELEYIRQAVASGKISGNGVFTSKCHRFFSEKYNFQKVLLTASCTDALEMAAMLIDIKAGDEVIMPSFTFVSCANAFILRGAKVVFADSQYDHPNIDPGQIEKLITKRTRAILVVHYSGIACPMDEIMALARKHNLLVVEDAAHAIDSFYKGAPLGSIGHLAVFSFHETKNIISGEGGLLVINDDRFAARADIIWEKGTNRAAFFKGEVDKYSWVDIGSSFLPSEVTAAFLFAQLERLPVIQNKRKEAWQRYMTLLKPLAAKANLSLPVIPDFATINGHLFYLICSTGETRDLLLQHLKKQEIYATFHYLPLHKSPFAERTFIPGAILPRSESISRQLIRLPLYYELSEDDQLQVVESIKRFFQ